MRVRNIKRHIQQHQRPIKWRPPSPPPPRHHRLPPFCQEAFHVQSVQRNAQLNALLSELARLQKVQQEQLNTQQLHSAEDSQAEMREQLHSQTVRVEESIAEADRLCSEGAQTLSPEQFHALKESRQRLHATFESLLRQTDAALSRLDGVTALLLEFASRTSTFQSWVFERGRELDALRAASGDPATLEDNRRMYRELTEHILSKRAELSAIAQLAQRIESEIGAYLAELSRRNESPAPGLQRHHCVEAAQRAQDDYEALLGAKQELSQLLRRVANCATQYEQKVDEVNGWMAELERAVSHANMASSGDTADRLDNLSRLNQSAVEGQPRIEAVEAAAKLLDEATAHTDAHQRLQAEHVEHLAHVRHRFRTLSDRLRDCVHGARAELTHQEGLARGLQQMDEWLNVQERKLTRPRTIPLGAGKLNELKYEDQLERGELDNRAKTLTELGELLGSERHGPREELGQHFGTVSDRFWRLEAMTRAQSDNLRDAVDAFEHWQRSDETLAERMGALSDAVAQLNAADIVGAERLGNELNALEAGDWAELEQLANRMVQLPNVEQTEQLTRKMRSNQSQLARIRRDLGAKLESGEKTSELRRQFRENADKIGAELAEVEHRINDGLAEVSPNPIDRDQQRGECDQLGQRLDGIGRDLRELEELGSVLIQNGGVMGGGGKRRSTEMDEADSAGGGGLLGLTRQVFELHRKKDNLDRALVEIDGRIEKRNDERRRWSADRDALCAWMEEERGRTSTEVQGGQQRMRHNQHRLTQLKLNMEQMKGGEQEMNAMDELDQRWTVLENGWTSMDKCISIAGGLAEDAKRLEKWVESKARLADQCVVSAAEVKLTDAQLAIAKMLEAEFVDERPHWERFNDDAAEVVRLADSEPFCAKIVARVDELNRRWRQLEQSLTARVNGLGASRRTTEEFDLLLRELQRKVRSVELSLNETAGLRSGEAEQKQKLDQAQRQLAVQLRPSLDRLREKGAHLLESPVASTALRSDVEEKVDNVGRMVQELDTKMDSIRRAAESETAAEDEFHRELDTLTDWIREQKRELDTEAAPVAAEPGRLGAQLEQFRPKYETVLAREGQVIVLGSKATSILAKTPTTALKERLFALNEANLAGTLFGNQKTPRKLDRVKRALDELVEAEQSVKTELNELTEQKLTACGNSPEPEFAMPVLESLQQRLHALGPGVDSVFTVMDKLERALGGDSGAETKKHRLALEQLRRDYAALVSECNAALEQARNKETLMARFDSEADALRSLLDDTEQKLSNDLIGKDALKFAIVEFDARWSTASAQLQSVLVRLRPLVDTVEASRLEATSGELAASATQLREMAARRMAKIEHGEGRLGSLLDRTTNLANELSVFAEKIGALPPIGREQSVLNGQLTECHGMEANVGAMMDKVAELGNEWHGLVDDAMGGGGVGHQTQAKSAKSDLHKMDKQLEKHKDELALRRRRISEVARRVNALDGEVSALHAAIQHVSAHEVLSQPLGADANALRAQQEVLKMLKDGELSELADRKEKAAQECKELIKGVGTGVSTDTLEGHLRSLNSAWQQLASSDVERKERELEAAVQALGSFREAQQSLLNWLEQTEQLIAEQSPPSTDHKVVKAQLQNQEFQFKLVEDKRPNVEGFMELAQKLERMSVDEANTAQLRTAREHIASRYSELLNMVNDRHQQLQDALVLSQEWAKLHRQLGHFLDESERQMHAFERIPTDAQKMEEQTQLLKELQQLTDERREQFDRLVELANYLGAMVSLEEGQELDSEMHQLVARYDTLGVRLGQIEQLMGTLAEDIAQFLQSTQQLLNWLKEMEEEMHKFDDPSTEPEELGAQSDELATLVAAVADQGQLVTQVVEISQELCAHTSGAEALSLQFRTDNLRQRYTKLADDASGRINVLEKALPLAEDLKDGMGELVEHLDGVEEDLQNLGQVTLEEQFQLVNTIESDMGPAREQLDALHGVSVELQRLVTEQRASKLARESAELHKRFSNVADAVSRKADQLRQAERQSRHTFDVLDFWIDWFNDVQEQIVQADKPAVDMEQLRQQLRQQHALNQEIVTEKSGLRDMVVEATKVARELSSTLGGQEGQEAMMAKVERAKRLADETVELGTERVAELEQAFALCKELDGEYNELNEWMDGVEKELHACEPITLGIAAKALLAQQQHNNSMLQQIQGQRPMVAKFDRNVTALSELCSEADEQNLKHIAENVAERFDDLANAFRERGDALSSSIEQCSQLTDRLNIFLSNLSNALDQLRAQESASCRPPVLRRQIAENGAIFDLLRQKEQHFCAMKAQAQEVLARAGPNQQPMVADMSQRLEEMDQRWLELHSGAEYRRTHLEALLPVTEHFWAQLEAVQQSIATVRQRADAFGAEGGTGEAADHDDLEEQLQQRQQELQAVQNVIEHCAVDVQQVIAEGIDLSAKLDAEEERSFVQQHLTMLQTQWDTLLGQYTQISGNLSTTMEQALQFYTLLQQLTAFMVEKETQCAGIIFGSSPQLSVDAIREQLRALEELRRELDEWALNREQLNQMGAELCAQPGTQSQAPPIRLALSELKQRWARLYAQLRDTEQHLERSLLDMGQLAHAHDQMMAWLATTESLLATVDTTADGGLKHVEIELCKLRMIQNDIAAHQPTFEAIQATGQKMMQQDPQCANATQPMLDELAHRWALLGQQAEKAWVELERARSEANSRSDDLTKWTVWLNDLMTELRSNRPIGGLPDTAMAQLDEFRIVQADVEQRRPQMDECLNRLEEQLAATSAGTDAGGAGAAGGEWLVGQHKKLRADWTLVQQKLAERDSRLRKALEEALELALGMQEVHDWLHGAEEHLAMAPTISKMVEPLGDQLAQHQAFHAEMMGKSELMKELCNKGIRIQLSCEKKDAIPMKNRLVSLKHRTDKLAQRSNERLKTLTMALDESRLFFDSRRDLLRWTDEQQRWLHDREAENSARGTGEHIREALADQREFAESIQRKAGVYEDVRRRGGALEEHAPPGEKLQLVDANEELDRRWETLTRDALRRQRALEEALIQSGKFDEVLAELLDWLATVLPPLEAELHAGNHLGDVDTLHTLVKEHHELTEQSNTRKDNVEKVRERAQRMVEASTGDAQELAELDAKLTILNNQWDKLNQGIGTREERLTNALKKAVDLSELMHDLGTALQDIEARLRRRPALCWDEKSVLAEQLQLDQLRHEFTGRLPELEKVLELAKELQRNAHPRAEAPLRELVRGMGTRWELLDQLIGDRAEKLRTRLDEIRQHEQNLNELLGFVEEKQGQLELMRDCSDEGQLSRLGTLMGEQQMFKTDLQQRQTDLDDLLRAAHKRHSLLRGGEALDDALFAGGDGGEQYGDGGGGTRLSKQSGTGTRRDSQPQQHPPLSPSKRVGSRLKLHEKSLTDARTSLGTAIDKKRPRRKSDTLNDQWKHLWTDLLQYEQKLKERRADLEELERLKGFTFDEWRERYLAWNDHGKARVSDLFRRIDKSGTGMVPRKLFIDGILASKFSTTELEMARVADEFDKGDGLIASREFMNALRFDPKKMRRYEPKTETERIHEEIARETARCTCAHQFPIQHISSDKDRVQYGFGFGGSMKRMVRILRSTVMVRVGGGWEALDGFLAKHDPCRAKGRINVDLLRLVPDDHLRPSGAVDRMEMFTRRKNSSGGSPSTTSSAREVEKLLGYSPGQPGPIMKIREKT
ncbi:hypothetical protein GPALN_006390 [Globodera pallida]|nr:hypothetical protein GPALN_006390 [Globodera pallida]